MNKSVCDQCSYRCSSRIQLIKHSFSSHSSEPLFKLRCSIHGCLYCFLPGSSFSSFKTHVSRKNPDWQKSLAAYDGTSGPILTQVANEEFGERLTVVQEQENIQALIGDSEEQLPMDVDNYLEDDIPFSSHDSRRTAALFLLTFKEKYNLSQRALDYAIGSVGNIVQLSLMSALGETAAENVCFDNPFGGLQTEYRQNQFYKNEFGLVVRDEN